MRSKEDQVLELFFNSPKYWHFDEILKKSGVSRPRLAEWLKKLTKDGIIKKVKPRGKMPYYVPITKSKTFQHKKRLFALKRMTESGLLNHLASLKKAKVVIVFGSFSRADWYDSSDIDIFIYGDDSDFRQGKYELKLKRDIQVHNAKDNEGLKRIKKMLPYIISGDFVKGSIEELGVDIHARA